MIELNNLTKHFDDITAVDHVSVSIKDNEVFGLIGTNGAGKSTILRMVAGIMRPDSGTVVVDNMPIFDNVITKKQIFFIPDEPYFFQNANATDMEAYYVSVYEKFNIERFENLLTEFEIDKEKKINTFSKGMKKQLALLLGLCTGTKYLLCDETFDGLDAVMRQSFKVLIRKEMEERGLTPIVASHNLRELEDICDHVGLLHKGGILLSKDIDSMKLGINKIQCVFTRDEDADTFAGRFNVLVSEKRGRLFTFTLRNQYEEIESEITKFSTVFYEILPLSLEEIFICETGVVGYDVRKLILG